MGFVGQKNIEWPTNPTGFGPFSFLIDVGFVENLQVTVYFWVTCGTQVAFFF